MFLSFFYSSIWKRKTNVRDASKRVDVKCKIKQTVQEGNFLLSTGMWMARRTQGRNFISFNPKVIAQEVRLICLSVGALRETSLNSCVMISRSYRVLNHELLEKMYLRHWCLFFWDTRISKKITSSHLYRRGVSQWPLSNKYLTFYWHSEFYC